MCCGVAQDSGWSIVCCEVQLRRWQVQVPEYYVCSELVETGANDVVYYGSGGKADPDVTSEVTARPRPM
jgi:hypothetical protein